MQKEGDTELGLEVELEEDENFISSTAGASLAAYARVQEAIELQTRDHTAEDETILQAGSRTAEPISALASQGKPERDDEDLEEDPSFAEASSSQPLPCSQVHAPLSKSQLEHLAFSQTTPWVSEEVDEEDDSLPSASQFIRAATGRSLDVSYLNLGRQSNASRHLLGTAYNGKRITFKRQKGNTVVGEVNYLQSKGGCYHC